MKHIHKLQIIFVILALLLLASCDLEKHPPKEEDIKIGNQAKPTEKPALKTETAKPPPLMKPIDGSSMSIDQLVQAMDKAALKQQDFETSPLQKKAKKEKPKKVMYKWTDKFGTPHMSSDLSSVPARYRKSVTEIELQSGKTKEQTGKKYKVGQGTFYKKYLKENKRKKKGYARWNKRYKSALRSVEKATAARKRLEKNVPSCTLKVIYGQTKTSSETCEKNWKRKLERLRKNEKTKKERLAKLKEDARRAGVPPGYMR